MRLSSSKISEGISACRALAMVSSQHCSNVWISRLTSIGSIETMRSAAPRGMRSERMADDEMRRFDCTSPPRWLMPWTSACLM